MPSQLKTLSSLRASLPFIIVFFLLLIPSAPAAELKLYNSKYYSIHTDVDPIVEREAEIRLTRMAEEYHLRTKDFAGTINRRLPFFMFSNQEEYLKAGGPKGSGGVFRGDNLMSIADKEYVDSGFLWHTLQHEGFHQFVFYVIGGEVPIWVNEGLAEYFGEGMFTGDGFVTGLVPAGRAQSIKKDIAAKKFKPIQAMMALSHEQWNEEISHENYDQAWSMIHFLAHAENGKYQKPFTRYMIAIGRGRPSGPAWNDSFGSAAGFEERWRDYWTNLPSNPTLDLYCKANVATLTSFLARATAQKQTFKTFDEFLAAASAKTLKIKDEDWLPPGLLHQNIEIANTLKEKTGATFTLETTKSGLPRLVCQSREGATATGTFTLRGSRPQDITVDLKQPKPLPPKKSPTP